MNIWRFALGSFVTLVVAFVLVAVSHAGITLRSSLRRLESRAIVSTAVVLAFIASPAVSAMFMDALTESSRRTGTYIDYSSVSLLIAPLLSLILLVAGRVLFSSSLPVAERWRAGFSIYVLLFLAANAIDRCNPGWNSCFGFPFAFVRTSDAVVIMNGENESNPFSAVGLGGNALLLAAGAFAI